MKTIEDTTEADFDTSFALNVKGPYFLVHVRSFSFHTARIHANAFTPESRSAHERRVSYHPDINIGNAYLNRDAKLPSLLCYEGGNRVND